MCNKMNLFCLATRVAVDWLSFVCSLFHITYSRRLHISLVPHWNQLNFKITRILFRIHVCVCVQMRARCETDVGTLYCRCWSNVRMHFSFIAYSNVKRCGAFFLFFSWSSKEFAASKCNICIAFTKQRFHHTAPIGCILLQRARGKILIDLSINRNVETKIQF